MIGEAFDALVTRRVVARGGAASLQETGGWPLFRYDIPGQGSGPPVVLVHGLAGDAHNFFSLFEPLRALSRRVLAFDLPGHGKSPLPANRAPPTIEQHYEILTAFLQDVAREPVVLVGNSMGGALVAHATADQPQRVAGTALLSPAGAHIDKSTFDEVRSLFQGATNREVQRTVEKMMHRRLPGTSLVVSHFRRKFEAPAVKALLESGYRSLEPLQVMSIRQPLTLVWGDSERILPADGLQWFRRHLPGHARIVVLDRCGHVPQLEHPRVVMRLLADLYEELGRPVRGLTQG